MVLKVDNLFQNRSLLVFMVYAQGSQLFRQGTH